MVWTKITARKSCLRCPMLLAPRSSISSLQVLQEEVADCVFRSIENPLDITLWNRLMKAYTKESRFVEVLSVYEGLLRFPYLKPDSYTYPSLLKACSVLKNLGYGEKVHGHLMKGGFLSDVVIASSLVSVYAKCDQFTSAANLFDEMLERDLASWNNVASCYYQSGQYEKALEFFVRMKNTGLEPDSTSFTVAISSCARLLDVERGSRIHDEVLRSGLAGDSYVSAALVDMYGKCGFLERAREVFDGISNKSLVAWNAMIGGYGQIGDITSCIQLIAAMNGERVRPSPTTISNLLLACAKSAQLRHGRSVHGFNIRNNVVRDIDYDISLVDFYLKCGCVEPAEKLFKKLPKSNVISWNVMISGYVSAGCYFKALDTYDDMRAAGIKPDAVSLTGALKACSQLAALETGKEVHNHIKESRLNSNEVVMGSLLNMYAKCGAVQEAETVFNQLPTKDLVSWTSMVEAYGSHGRASEALNLFDQMVQAGVRPDRVTFLAVISACSHAGLVDQGKHYFNLMVDDYGITPTTAEYSCLIDLLCRAGRLHEAYYILQNSACVKEDIELLSTLLASCFLRRESELARKIANLLIEKDPNDPSTYIVLEKIYAAANEWNQARKIRFKMKELGLKKNPGCSWIEVDQKIRSFLAEDNTFAEAESVYDCLSLIYSRMEWDEMEDMHD